MFFPKIFLVLVVVFFSQITMPEPVQALVKTYIVNSDAKTPDNNPGDGICQINSFLEYCTLHAAIQEANLDGVNSIIKFAAPMAINYPSLPSITESGTTIDASNQWDGTWPTGSPGVSIVGANYSRGLLNIQANTTTVLGIEFTGSSSVGIYIDGASAQNVIGGNGAGERNVFLYGIGVKVQGGGPGTIISNNYFGTLDGQNPIPGETGIEIVRSSGIIVEKNLIGGQTKAGIHIGDGGTNHIRNDNIIGANKQRNKTMANTIGILIEVSKFNLVMNNFIAGNSSNGIEILMGDSNFVLGNTIGDKFSFGNGGDGIHISSSSNNTLGSGTSSNMINNNSGHGIWFDNCSNNLIQGNYINNNTLDGVHVKKGTGNIIGGASPLGNELNANGGSGVHLTGTSTTGNTVSGNYIGLADGGFNAGNTSYGVRIDAGASSNSIGGLGTSEGNLIGWNVLSGIYIAGAATKDNVVEGNIIGAAVDWNWPAPNGRDGISIFDGAHNNWIGIGNTILANGMNGIAIADSDNNVVWFNFIGTNITKLKWGNHDLGVAIANSAGNTISHNEIAYNGISTGEAGVYVYAGAGGNPITINSIHDNGGAGIELYNGGNGGLAAPSISKASCKGPVTGTACTGCTIEIFSDYADEGRTYEGTATADPTTGAFSWSGNPSGPNVTATATNGANTSQFSSPANTGNCECTFFVLPLENDTTVVICL